MKESSEAHGLAVFLEAHSLSKELVDQLEKHAEFSERAFKTLQAMVMKKTNDAAIYKKFFDTMEKQRDWYHSRKQVAEFMKKAVKAKPKSKAKAKAKTKA